MSRGHLEQEEEHPSFAVVRVTRRSSSKPVRMFDSSIGHREYVHLEIARASRRRDLHRDWIYGFPQTLIEVEMSLTQWGALVSSFGQGSGTPVTLHRLNGKVVPEGDHESRLAVTAREVQNKTRESTQDVTDAVVAVEKAFADRAGRREMQAVINTLASIVRNLPANMKFAADSLTEHAEDVVSKARADIEASHQYGQLGYGASPSVPELEAGP